MAILLFLTVLLLVGPPIMWYITYTHILPLTNDVGDIVYTKRELQRKVRERTFQSTTFKYWCGYVVVVFTIFSII